MIDYEKAEMLDKRWKDVMELAKQNGFIMQAYGGVALLGTHQNQIKEFGEKDYLKRQWEMHRIDMTKREGE